MDERRKMLSFINFVEAMFLFFLRVKERYHIMLIQNPNSELYFVLIKFFFSLFLSYEMILI